MIELTEQQLQALENSGATPPRLVNPRTKETFVLLRIDEYERLKETLDVLSDPDLMKQIRESEAYFASGKKGLSFEDVFEEPLVPRKRKKRR